MWSQGLQVKAYAGLRNGTELTKDRLTGSQGAPSLATTGSKAAVCTVVEFSPVAFSLQMWEHRWSMVALVQGKVCWARAEVVCRCWQVKCRGALRSRDRGS